MSPSAPNVGETIPRSNIPTVPAWKMELNERLAATRLRRVRGLPEQAALPGLEDLGQKSESRTARLAAKVAERYANAPSYKDVLAAEVLARAQAAALKKVAKESAVVGSAALSEVASFPDWHVAADSNAAPVGADQPETAVPACEEAEEERVIEPLPANLIEFPRELVAQRRMRPRIAEGPLRETAEDAMEGKPLREDGELPPARVSRSVNIGPAPANWAPILLDEEPVSPAAVISHSTELQTASIEDRVMAGLFDLALIVAAFAIFVLVFVACTAHPPTGKPALLGGGLVLTGFALLYHYLFFCYAEGTPGMRYAKIALCTFDDENPTRAAMCRRVLLLLLSAAPLGLGFLWACFDQDRLGWHDRISRMYQRSYS